jgi:hypothetical protein
VLFTLLVVLLLLQVTKVLTAAARLTTVGLSSAALCAGGASPPAGVTRWAVLGMSTSKVNIQRFLHAVHRFLHACPCCLLLAFRRHVLISTIMLYALVPCRRLAKHRPVNTPGAMFHSAQLLKLHSARAEYGQHTSLSSVGPVVGQHQRMLRSCFLAAPVI